MRSKLHFYPQLRKDFENVEEICAVINKGRTYVLTRLNGEKEFTYNDMRLMTIYLGEDVKNARVVCRKE